MSTNKGKNTEKKPETNRKTDADRKPETEKKKGSGRKKWIIIAIVSAVLIAAGIITYVLVSRNMASSMKVLRIEGIVHLTDQNGQEKSLTTQQRLQSGDRLETESQSLVSIGLDDHKIITLQEMSEAVIQKQAKWLRLDLKRGSVFFQVNQALAEDETFDIQTTTMMVGIRGTSGYVTIEEGGQESLLIRG